MFQATFSAYFQSNAPELTGQCFKRQMDNDSERTLWKQPKSLFKKNKYNVAQWPSQSPDGNPGEHVLYFICWRQNWWKNATRQKGTEDSCNREQRSCSDMTRDKTQWWCLWAPDFQLLLSTKDLQTNIKSNNLIYDFILVSISFTPFKKKKPHIQCVVIHTMFRLFG